MFKAIKFFILLLTLSCSGLSGQQLSHQVLVPAAGLASAVSVFYSQTIGETAVEIIGNSGYILTQGFQQPSIRFFPESPPEGSGVEAYPNPVTDYLKVELYGDFSRSFIIYVINLTGTIVSTRRLDFSLEFWHIEHIDMSWLGKGLYLVRVVSEDGEMNRTFKIEKM